MTDTMTPVAPVTLAEDTTPTKVDKGTYFLEKQSMNPNKLVDDNKKRVTFDFWFRQFKTIAAAIAALGEDTSVACINKFINTQARLKAYNALPQEETSEETNSAIIELFKNGDTLLISEDEAETFVPGERADNNPASLIAKANAAKKAGDMELARKYQAIAKEKIAALMAGLDDIS